MAAGGSNKSTTTRRASDVPEGMRRVQIAYSATDPGSVGTVVDVPEAEARSLVGGGRARYVAEGTKLGKQDGKPELVEPAPASVESTTAAPTDGPATPGQA